MYKMLPAIFLIYIFLGTSFLISMEKVSKNDSILSNRNFLSTPSEVNFEKELESLNSFINLESEFFFEIDKTKDYSTQLINNANELEQVSYFDQMDKHEAVSFQELEVYNSQPGYFSNQRPQQLPPAASAPLMETASSLFVNAQKKSFPIKKYRCQCQMDSYKQCGKSFISEEELIKHQQENHYGAMTLVLCGPKKKYYCDSAQQKYYCSEEYCDYKSFNSRSALQDHKAKYHATLRCQACKKLFATQPGLHQHKKKFHPELDNIKNNEIKIKSAIFEKKNNSMDQFFLLTNEDFNLELNNPGVANSHNKQDLIPELKLASHKQKITQSSFKEIQILSCSICLLKFSSQRGLFQHLSRMHPQDKTFKIAFCPYCNIALENQLLLNFHIEQVHKKVITGLKYANAPLSVSIDSPCPSLSSQDLFKLIEQQDKKVSPYDLDAEFEYWINNNHLEPEPKKQKIA